MVDVIYKKQSFKLELSLHLMTHLNLLVTSIPVKCGIYI